MTTRELDRQTREFSQEFVADSFGPPPRSARAQWARARRRAGRPKRGLGVKPVSVTIEAGLLARSDALARELRITRASLISRGLKAVLAAEGKL
jgi:hypothetical protein